QDQKDTGYSIGGPVFFSGLGTKTTPKLFFFLNQEYAHRFTPPTAPTNVRVPTALVRTGDFLQSRDNNGNLYKYIKNPQIATSSTVLCQATPATPVAGVNYQGACFADGGVVGKIPANRLYGPGLAILNLYPLPNYTPVGSDNFNYQTQQSSRTPERNDTL